MLKNLKSLFIVDDAAEEKKETPKKENKQEEKEEVTTAIGLVVPPAGLWVGRLTGLRHRMPTRGLQRPPVSFHPSATSRSASFQIYLTQSTI